MNVGSSATIRGDLADVLKENMYGEGDYIGLFGMPILEVGRKSGTYAKIDFSEQATSANVARAPGANYNRTQREATSDTYTCVEYGQEEPVDDGEAADLANYFDAELDAAESGKGTLLLEQENRIAAILFDVATTFLSYTTAVTTSWATAATCTPVADVYNAKIEIKKQVNGGLNGAKFVALCNDTVIVSLLNSADVKNRIASTTLAQMGWQAQLDALAKIMGLDEIHSSSIQRAGSAVWSTDQFGIYLVGSGRSLKSMPQVARSMLWTADTAENALVESYREEAIRSNIIRVRQNVDEELLTARAGHVLTNVD